MQEFERRQPLDMTPEEFRKVGHRLVDRIAHFLGDIRSLPVTKGEPPSVVRQAIGDRPLPSTGEPADVLVEHAAELIIEHSLFNGHPRFWGYITSSAAPIGALADLLAASVNSNAGAWSLSPAATEIELQTIRWICELIGYPVDSGGVMVSGGNMANFVCFLAARKAKAPFDVQKTGFSGTERMICYVSAETHTWVEKAADEFGIGTNQVRWVPVDDKLRMRVDLLRQAIADDRAAGDFPFLVVGTAGTVGTGAIDPLDDIADVCESEDVWFHVDGAYGGFAATLPDFRIDLQAISRADSIAVDPHKWLYSPIEAGCAVVRNLEHMRSAFSYHPPYYRFDQVGEEPAVVMADRSPQNSRGFRALKVWLGLQQAGREGIVRSIAEDIELARHLYTILQDRDDFEVFTTGLSITTFRYVPAGIPGDVDRDAYLNEINETLVTELQEGGEAYVSHTRIRGHYVLRACVVNFRTEVADIEALPDIISRIGLSVHERLTPA
ncbi:MAG: aspartate aminotransferase family protein [Rhodothermia bacterium]